MANKRATDALWHAAFEAAQALGISDAVNADRIHARAPEGQRDYDELRKIASKIGAPMQLVSLPLHVSAHLRNKKLLDSAPETLKDAMAKIEEAAKNGADLDAVRPWRIRIAGKLEVQEGSPLDFLAVRKGGFPFVNRLIDLGAKIGEKPKRTVWDNELMRAVKADQLETAALFLERGAGKYSEDDVNWALQTALEKGNFKLARLAMIGGATVNEALEYMNEHVRAALLERPDVAKFVKEVGTNANNEVGAEVKATTIAGNRSAPTRSDSRTVNRTPRSPAEKPSGA